MLEKSVNSFLFVGTANLSAQGLDALLVQDVTLNRKP